MEREITIDPSGRVVIPKDVRQRHRLAGGTRLVLVDEGERLVLIPKQRRATLKEKGGLLVFQGSMAPEDADLGRIREAWLDRVAEP